MMLSSFPLPQAESYDLKVKGEENTMDYRAFFNQVRFKFFFMLPHGPRRLLLLSAIVAECGVAAQRGDVCVRVGVVLLCLVVCSGFSAACACLETR